MKRDFIVFHPISRFLKLEEIQCKNKKSFAIGKQNKKGVEFQYSTPFKICNW
jgi:hypothetical protein